MVPLTTFQGLKQKELEKLIGNKKLYIWGNGILAQMVITSLKAMNIKPIALLDNRKSQIGKQIYGFKIKDINNTIKQKDIFIIIASSAILNYAKEELRKAGFEENKHFISYFKIPRPVAAIDVYSGCNIKCITCPQGNLQNLRPLSKMSFKIYKKVLDKLIKELPLLSGIELFTWGEPLLNEDIVKIIKYTQKFVPCIISTNLQTSDKLIDILKERPSLFIISVNSLSEDYEKISKGASWEVLLNNLKLIGNFIKKEKININIEVRLYKYKSTKDEDIKWFKSFCEKNRLTLKIEYPYLNPYEHYLNIELKKTDNFSEEIINNLPWDYNYIINLAKKDKHLPCLSQRIFPIINADLSVSLCHTYYGPIIAKNFLEISLKELINIRHNQNQCKLCQKYGLHRLDLEVLKKRYPKEFTKGI